MNWKFTTDRPIYAQLVEMIQKKVLSGVYPLGSNMPSVRTLALEASVNPNTMQRALAELEEQRLLYTQRTSGRTVTTDEELITGLKKRIASHYIEQYFEGMKSLGIERDAAAEMLASKTNGSSVSARAETTTMDTFVAQVSTVEAPTTATEEPAEEESAAEESAAEESPTAAEESPAPEATPATKTFIIDTSTTTLEVTR